MEVLREGDSVWVQSRETRSPLKDYTLKHKVEIQWDLNEDAIREQMFKLKIDDYEVILDAEELRRSIRMI